MSAYIFHREGMLGSLASVNIEQHDSCIRISDLQILVIVIRVGSKMNNMLKLVNKIFALK